MRRSLAALLVLALSSGCRPPEHVSYRSLWRDFTAAVPWGWQIITDAQDDAFTQTTFIGPFDPDFYLGAPSLSVRWYKSFKPHRLRDGRLESYSSAHDFYRQMIRDVYGSQRFVAGLELPDGSHADGPSEITLAGSGLKASYFTVLSPTAAPPKMQWGINVGRDGKAVILRKHAYALVPVEGGFYVLCYPATAQGYDRGAAHFRRLLGAFVPVTAGPGGPTIRLPARAGS